MRHILHLPRPAAVPGRAGEIRARWLNKRYGSGGGGLLFLHPRLRRRHERRHMLLLLPLRRRWWLWSRSGAGVEWRDAPALRALRFWGQQLTLDRGFCALVGPATLWITSITIQLVWILAQQRPINCLSEQTAWCRPKIDSTAQRPVDTDRKEIFWHFAIMAVTDGLR